MKNENFAVSLRKSKKEQIITKRRMRNFTALFTNTSSFNHNQSIKDQLLNGQIDKENMRPNMQSHRNTAEIEDIFENHVRPKSH